MTSTLNSVAGRLANFPPCLPRAEAAQKRPRPGRNSGDITWGYVARMGRGGDQIPGEIAAGVRFTTPKNLSTSREKGHG